MITLAKTKKCANIANTGKNVGKSILIYFCEKNINHKNFWKGNLKYVYFNPVILRLIIMPHLFVYTNARRYINTSNKVIDMMRKLEQP